MSERIHHNVEQNTPEWHQLRCGLLCSSEIESVITPKTRKISAGIDKLIYKKHAALISGEFEDFNVSFAAKRGKELEPFARAYYQDMTGVAVNDGGFNSYGRLGASTDGVAGDRVLEIKCLSGENHYAALVSAEPWTDYHFQTQAEMYVLGKSLCDLFFYHPTMNCRRVTLEYEPSMTELFEQAEAAFTQKWREVVVKYKRAEASLMPAPIQLSI